MVISKSSWLPRKLAENGMSEEFGLAHQVFFTEGRHNQSRPKHVGRLHVPNKPEAFSELAVLLLPRTLATLGCMADLMMPELSILATCAAEPWPAPQG